MTIILSAKKAMTCLENGDLENFALISIRDNKVSPVYDKISRMGMRCKGIHVVNMHDIQFGESIREGEIMPTVDLVRPALEFAKKHENVAVHCTAGVSRSSAMGFLVELQKTGSVEEAVKVLNPWRHFPNMAIIMIGEHILGVDIVETIIEFNEKASDVMFDKDNE